MADDTLAGDGFDELMSVADAALNDVPGSGAAGVDVVAVGSSTDGHEAFRDEVGAMVAERVDDLESEAEDRRRTALLVAGAVALVAVALVAVALLAVVLVQAARAR